MMMCLQSLPSPHCTQIQAVARALSFLHSRHLSQRLARGLWISFSRANRRTIKNFRLTLLCCGCWIYLFQDSKFTLYIETCGPACEECCCFVVPIASCMPPAVSFMIPVRPKLLPGDMEPIVHRDLKPLNLLLRPACIENIV